MKIQLKNHIYSYDITTTSKEIGISLPLSYIIFITSIFASFGQVAADIYLPSLPAITVGLHTTTSLSQATIFLYMTGFSISRLIYGPISDAVGRKKPLGVGLLLCLVGTIISTFTHSINVLIVSRFLQGAGAGAGVVLSGAIARDLLKGNTLAKTYSYISMFSMVFIAAAPFLGGYLQHWFGWRSSFVFMSIYALFALIAGTVFLPETNKHLTKENLKLSKIKANLSVLFTNRNFIIFNICVFFIYAAILSWLTLGPILLENTVGISPVQFGWLAFSIGGFYILGAFLNSIFVEKCGIKSMLKTGAYMMLSGGLLILFCWLIGEINFWEITIALVIFFIGISMIFPNAIAGALMPFQKISGIAGAILGFIQIVGGVIASGIMAILPDTSQLPLAISFILSSIIILLVIKYLRKI